MGDGAAELVLPGLFPGLGRIDGQTVLARSALFDVVRVDTDQGPLVVKLPSLAPRRDDGVFRTSQEGTGSRTHGQTGLLDWEGGKRAGLLSAMLVFEAEAIRASRGTWNHEVVQLSSFALDRATETEDQHASPFGLALVTPFHPGLPLSSVDRAQLRRTFPRILPAMFRALSATPHRDLRLEHILVDYERERFSLIDPGVVVRGGHRKVGGWGVSETVFVTNPSAYPILPPTYEVDLGPESTFEGHVARLQECSIVVGAAMGALDAGGARARPAPPDLLALGVLYYEALTGRHPYFDHPDRDRALPREPAWLNEEFGGDLLRLSPSKAAIEALARRPVPPGEIVAGLSSGEQDLVMALLDLRVRSAEVLQELVVRAIAAAAGGVDVTRSGATTPIEGEPPPLSHPCADALLKVLWRSVVRGPPQGESLRVRLDARGVLEGWSVIDLSHYYFPYITLVATLFERGTRRYVHRPYGPTDTRLDRLPAIELRDGVVLDPEAPPEADFTERMGVDLLRVSVAQPERVLDAIRLLEHLAKGGAAVTLRAETMRRSESADGARTFEVVLDRWRHKEGTMGGYSAEQAQVRLTVSERGWAYERDVLWSKEEEGTLLS